MTWYSQQSVRYGLAGSHMCLSYVLEMPEDHSRDFLRGKPLRLASELHCINKSEQLRTGTVNDVLHKLCHGA